MKKYHFVYKTTCNITNHYYFGVHSTDDINDQYLGSGIKFRNYVKKYKKNNFVRKIVKIYETREKAFEYENQLLTKAILNDCMCLNVIEGGKGSKHRYDETFKDRISKTRKMRIEQGQIIPTKHTEEYKQALRLNNPGGKATAKPICQIDSMNGSVVYMWPSSRQAGLTLNMRSWRNFSYLANNKRPQTAYGFYWRWANDPEIVNNCLETTHALNKIRLNKAMRAGKQVKQFSQSGELIAVWKNICEAARELKINNSSISLAVKTGKLYANYIWKF